jgi:hypothetical protein
LSGFTTARDLSSGSTADVDLRNAINEGLIPGPRMRVATEGIRGSIAGPRYFHLIDSPWEGRKQVRVQLKNGADFIKVYAAGIRANPAMGYGAPTMTAEEQNAIVDEAPDFIGTLNQGRAAAVSVSPAIPTRRMGEPESRRQRFSSLQTIPALSRASNCSSMAAVVKPDQLKRRGVGPVLASVSQRSRIGRRWSKHQILCRFSAATSVEYDCDKDR